MAGFDLISCVVKLGDASKVMRVAKEYGVKGGTISIGMGTVNSRLLDILGLSEVRKEIVYMVVEDDLAQGVLEGLCKDMHLHKPNHGIVFSISLSDFIGSKNTAGKKDTSSEVNKNVYKIIHTIVDKGKGCDVIDAANKAGARGGTIINARGSGIHEVQKLFNLEIEPEKEDVFIITKTAQKEGIVESIRTCLEIDEPGKGIIYVLDVKEVYGLHEG